MIRVAIAGVAGRMGQALVQAVDAQKLELQITAASVLAGDSVLAQDIGISALGQPAGVMAVADLETVIDDFDVLIDFLHRQRPVWFTSNCASTMVSQWCLERPASAPRKKTGSLRLSCHWFSRRI